MAKQRARASRWAMTLPDWHHDRLKLWAYVKRMSKAQLCSNIVAARIEANNDQISQMIEDIARSEGIDVADLIDQILNGDR